MKRFVWLMMTSLLILSGCSSDDSNMIVGTPHEGDDDQVDVPGTPQKDGTDPDKTDPDKDKPGDNPQNQPEDPENPPSEHPDNPPVEPDPNACELTQCGDAEVCLLTDKAQIIIIQKIKLNVFKTIRQTANYLQIRPITSALQSSTVKSRQVQSAQDFISIKGVQT